MSYNFFENFDKRFSTALAVFLVFSFFIAPIITVFADDETSFSIRTSDITKNDTVNITDQGTTDQILTTKTSDQTTGTEEVVLPEEDTEPMGLMGDSEFFGLENLTVNLTQKSRNTIKSDNSSGALLYNYPIVVPPGRNGLEPQLELDYNNQQAKPSNLFGYGWNINIPSIERSNKTGTDKLYTDNYFYSSLSGDLVLVSGSMYAPKVENGDFLTYSFSSNIWTVTDKKGTAYKFGLTSGSRQDDTSGTKIYKWMLEEIRDTNNNFIKYEYYKDGGQIYPLQITYTGNNTTDGVFQVVFSRESRTDVAKSYAEGFLVTTSYRINEIQNKINGIWIKKYTLGYTTGDNGYRTLLGSITESGQDESSNVTTLPATLFTYNTSTPGWTLDTTTWSSPTAFFSSLQSFIDINGDSHPDIIESYQEPTIPTKNTYLNDTHNGWILNTDLQAQIVFRERENRGGSHSDIWDQGVRIGDLNGDLLPDIIKSEDNENSKGGTDGYLNTSGLSWTSNTSWSSVATVSFNGDDSIHSWGGHFIDLNADGLTDIIRRQGDYGGAQLNTGLAYSTETTAWNPAQELTSPYSQFADVNNDGLPDIIYMLYDATWMTWYRYVYINKGDGTWESDPSWIPPVDIVSSNLDMGIRFFDVNADGLVDLVPHYPTMYAGTPTYLNTGTGWIATSSWNVPEAGEINFTSDPVAIVDINTDGSLDFFTTQNGIPLGTHVYKNNTTTPTDSLKKVTFSEGGDATVTYKRSPNYYDDSNNLLNPHSPIPLDTVYQLTTNPGFSQPYLTQTYTYEGGEFYFGSATDRRFAGFSKVTSVDAAGTKTINYYHQGNSTNSSQGEYSDHSSKIGKVYRTEVYDSSGNLYQKIINKWDKYNQATGRDFVKLVRTTTETYDGDSDHRDITKEYTYDNTTGNVTQKTDYGEVIGNDDGSYTDTGSDKATTTYSYATNGSGRYALSQETLKDQSNNKVTDTKYLYDNQTLGNLTVGNKTKEKHWKSASLWADTQWAYNTTYGIVTSMTDPRSKVTSYSYDSSNLYPATVTDPLTHTTIYTYDYSNGKVKQTTDVNSLVYQTVYDGLDRVIEEKIPDLTTPTTLVTKDTIAYTDTSGAVAIHKTDYLDGNTTVDTYQYFDGLHRLLQDRNEMEASNTFSVKDLAYNSAGLLQKESLPYSSTGGSKTSATGTTSLYTNYTYDPLQRQSTVSNNLGTTSYAYDQWMVTITDANSKQKNLYKDAYDNLVKVDEMNSGSTYTTNYTWNLAKNLTNITDASSNVRNFTYDGIGRRLTAEDLHASGDTSFGSWTYTYDDANNLTQSVDPKSQTINYTYDDINRPLTEDYTGATGTEITYTYDTGTYGIGHLYNSAVSGSSSTTNTYDANGNKASESEVINSVTLATSYTYDRQGNTLVITYPDSALVRYTYNTAGLLEKIETKESGGSYGDVVSNFDYNPMEQVITQADVNTVTTTNTYDSTKLYRLTQRVTQKGTTTKHQDLSFTYDAVGNITQIVDASATNSTKTANYVYDDLYRLTSATITGAAAGGNYTHTTSYDALGNISTKSDIGTYLYQGNSGTNYANPHAATSINGVTCTYDNNGNVTGNGTFNNTWDYKNQLSQTTVGATTVNYYYDDQGNRARYNVGSTNYYTPNRYYQKKGNTLNKYVYDGDNLVANIETKTSGVTPRYVHLDQLNSTAIVTSGSGNQVQLTDYYPFGQVRQNNLAGSFDSKKKYATHELDDDTGFDYVKARYYLGDRGRFMSEDKVFLSIGASDSSILTDPQLINSYSYSKNNPLRFADSNGLSPIDYVGGAITSLGANTVNAITGLVNSVFHPISTIQSIGGAISNLNQTINNLPTTAQNTIDQFKASSDFDRGQLGGTGVFFIGSFLIPESRFGALSDSTLVCRGGLCTADRFINGAEKVGADGKLYGISATAGNASVKELSKGFGNSKLGFGSLKDIEALGGKFVPNPKAGNPFYGKINGLTGEQLESIFGKNVISNPNK